MRLLKADQIHDFLIAENTTDKKRNIEISVNQLQPHIDFGCGCKIVQDPKTESLFPCKKHTDYAYECIDKGLIHRHIQ